MYILTKNTPRYTIASDLALEVTVHLNGVELYKEIATPYNNKIDINIADIIASSLVSELPANSRVSDVDYLTISYNSTTITLYVVDGGVDAEAADVQTFLKQNWLTWQPQTVTSCISHPRYLRYVAVEPCTVKVKAYRGEVVNTVILQNLEANSSYIADLSHSSLASVIDSINEVSAIDVWVEDADNVAISYTQRYLFTSQAKSDSDVFICKNSLGGYDVIEMLGELVERSKGLAANYEVDGATIQYDNDTSLSFVKNSGYFYGRSVILLNEFSLSTQRFMVHDGSIKHIVITEEIKVDKTKYTYSSATFSFSLSQKRSLFNVERVDLPSYVELKFDSEVFSLAPRLWMFPLAAISEELTLLVQTPYTQIWKQLPFSSVMSAVGQHEALFGRDAANQHPISAITGLEKVLADLGDIGGGSAPLNHTHDWVDITDTSFVYTKTNANLYTEDWKAKVLRTSNSVIMFSTNEERGNIDAGGTYLHNNLHNREFADSHPISAISGLVDALASKSGSAHSHAWSVITGKPTTFTPSVHNQMMSTIVGLSEALAAKSDIKHSHAWGVITGKPKLFENMGTNEAGFHERAYKQNGTWNEFTYPASIGYVNIVTGGSAHSLMFRFNYGDDQLYWRNSVDGNQWHGEFKKIYHSDNANQLSVDWKAKVLRTSGSVIMFSAEQ